MTKTHPFPVVPLNSTLLCVADFRVEGQFLGIGSTLFGTRRIGYVDGGTIAGPGLSGEILAGGGNWVVSGRLEDGTTAGTFEARVVWKTADGANIYVTYTGRTRITDSVRADFAAGASVDPARYYIRIAPVFESGGPRYAWLNGIVAIGVGERTAQGIRHSIHMIEKP